MKKSDEAEKVQQKRKYNSKRLIKIMAKEGRLKIYRDKTKQYRQRRTFLNKERKFNLKVEEEWAKSYQQPYANEANIFWSKI